MRASTPPHVPKIEVTKLFSYFRRALRQRIGRTSTGARQATAALHPHASASLQTGSAVRAERVDVLRSKRATGAPVQKAAVPETLDPPLVGTTSLRKLGQLAAGSKAGVRSC